MVDVPCMHRDKPDALTRIPRVEKCSLYAQG